MVKREIAALKREAAAAYKTYHGLIAGFSCGRAIAEHVSADVSEAKRAFNGIMDRLAAIDPTAPTARL